jgi:hypothetical protein
MRCLDRYRSFFKPRLRIGDSAPSCPKSSSQAFESGFGHISLTQGAAGRSADAWSSSEAFRPAQEDGAYVAIG